MIRIFRVLVPVSVLALFLAEVVVIFGCYAAAAYIDPDLDGDIFLIYESGAARIGTMVALAVFLLYLQGLYGDVRPRNPILLLQQLSLVFGVLFLAQALLAYWNRDLALPRKIMLTGSCMALPIMFGLRMLFTSAVRHAVRARRVLFLGFTPSVESLASHFSQHPELGLAPIGYLDQEDAAASVAIPRLGSVADLIPVIEQHNPHWLVIGKSEQIPPRCTDEFLELRFGGIRSERAASLYESTFGRVAVREVRPDQLIFDETLRPAPARIALQSAYSLLLTLVAALLTAPLFLLIAALVKLTSRGPVLARDPRTGLRETPFRILRFRCQNLRGETTAIGRLLRAARLDGLPRVINVLSGDMSLVGPRPIRPEFVQRLQELIPFYSQRHLIKPGLTGWEQVSTGPGRQSLDALQLLEYDLHYLANLSPALDLLVLLSAIRTLFSRQPA